MGDIDRATLAYLFVLVLGVYYTSGTKTFAFLFVTFWTCGYLVAWLIYKNNHKALDNSAVSKNK